jgi:hypothetical protein
MSPYAPRIVPSRDAPDAEGAMDKAKDQWRMIVCTYLNPRRSFRFGWLARRAPFQPSLTGVQGHGYDINLKLSILTSPIRMLVCKTPKLHWFLARI